MTIGVLFNIYAGLVFYQTKISSKLTKFLLYQQSVLYSVYSILTISLISTENYQPRSNVVPIDPVRCYVFQSGGLSRLLRIMIVCNIVLQSADKFWAIVYPKTYRIYMNYYVTLCGLVPPLYSSIAAITRFLEVNLKNGSCVPRVLPINQHLLLSLESLLRYGIPISLIIILNSLSLRKLYKQQVFGFKGKSNETTTPDSPTGGNKRGESSSHSFNTVQKIIFLNTFCLAIELTVIEVVAFLLTILNEYHIIQYAVGSSSRAYYQVLVVLLYDLNPCVQIWTIPTLRKTVRKHYHRCEYVWCHYCLDISRIDNDNDSISDEAETTCSRQWSINVWVCMHVYMCVYVMNVLFLVTTHFDYMNPLVTDFYCPFRMLNGSYLRFWLNRFLFGPTSNTIMTVFLIGTHAEHLYH